MSASTFLLPHDMSYLCRVCLQLPEESQYLDLTTIYDEEDGLTYGECFTICTQIDLNAGEGIPHHLCKTCGLELQMCYDFYKKIEESKKVIEECQRQAKVQKSDGAELLADSEKSKNVGEKKPLVQLINEKYVIINEEEQLPEAEQEPVECCEIEEGFAETASIKYEADDIDILENMSPTETNVHLAPSEEYNANVKTINENEVRIEVADHLEMEDYQNLETLEEEETETLQIKCGDSTIPVYETNFKTLENGENEEVEVYADDYDEEQEREDLDEQYAVETNEEEDIEVHLRWQENVVAVANKEHLPIEIENDEEMDEKCKSNENEVVTNDSEEEEISEELSKEHVISIELRTEDDTSQSKSENNNNNNKARKRHVGSYSCDFCHRVYPNYSRMKTHRLCHEADRPKFSCSQCGRMYATKQARDCHIQTAHEKSGFTCSICGKVFAIRKSLEIHVRYHTGDFPFACELCDRTFAQACHLNTHINVKHNKIRFSCDYPNCGKFFTSSSSLRNHEYTHGVMPFECEYCLQGYPAKAKLRIHIQRKHGINMNNDQLERMRKFHVMRSKVNLVQFVEK